MRPRMPPRRVLSSWQPAATRLALASPPASRGPVGMSPDRASLPRNSARKRLELLKETLPRAQRVAVLLNPDNSINERNLPAMERTARSLKVGLQRFEVRRPNEFKDVFSAMAKQRVDAVALPEDDFLNANR